VTAKKVASRAKPGAGARTKAGRAKRAAVATRVSAMVKGGSAKGKVAKATKRRKKAKA
jgi:hypothetical protein